MVKQSLTPTGLTNAWLALKKNKSDQLFQLLAFLFRKEGFYFFQSSHGIVIHLCHRGTCWVFCPLWIIKCDITLTHVATRESKQRSDWYFFHFAIGGAGRAPEAWRSAHRHEQGVLDRHDPRGGQKHAEQSQSGVRDANSIIKNQPVIIQTLWSQQGFLQGFTVSLTCLYTLTSLCGDAFCPQAGHHSGNSVHPWERAFSKQRISAQRNPATHGQQLPLRPLKSTH